MHAFRGKILRILRLFGDRTRISKICFGASKSRNIRNLFPLKSSGIILRISGLFSVPKLAYQKYASGHQKSRNIRNLFPLKSSGKILRISGLFGAQSRISKICFGASKSRNIRNLFPLKSSGKILRISGLFGDRTECPWLFELILSLCVRSKTKF